MVGSGMLKGLDYIFYAAFVGAILFVIILIYGGYKVWDNYYGDKEIVSPVRINPELQLTVKDNKVDTLFVYKLKK